MDDTSTPAASTAPPSGGLGSASSPAAGGGSASDHPGLALVLICVAQLMVVLDATITNIALPSIQSALTVSDANLQWVVTGYALAFGGLLLLGGRLGDLYGRRRIFMTGLIVFAIASGLGGFAQNEAMLLASRGLQGVGAAMASPAALALITTTFPPGAQRSRAFSVYAAMAGIGAAVGLLLGGWLTGLQPEFLGMSVDGWRLTFLINTPIGLAAAALAPILLPESASRRDQLDLPGALSATGGLISIVYGLSRAAEESNGWGDPWTITALAVGVGLLVAFVMVERSVRRPLLPLRILTNRTRATAFVAMMIVPAAMFGNFFFLSLYIQNVMGYEPLQAGVAFLPFAFGMVIGAGSSSRLIQHVDPRYLSGTGTLLASLGLLGFARLAVDDSPRALVAAAMSGTTHLGSEIGYWSHIFPPVLLMAIGMGLTFVPMTLCAVHDVNVEDTGVGSGVLNTSQQVGGALGLATLATVFVHFARDRGQEIGAQLQQLAGSGGPQPDPDTLERLQNLAAQAAQAHGSVAAYVTASGLVLVASFVIWTFMNVPHTALAEEAPAGVAA